MRQKSADNCSFLVSLVFINGIAAFINLFLPSIASSRVQ